MAVLESFFKDIVEKHQGVFHFQRDSNVLKLTVKIYYTIILEDHNFPIANESEFEIQ